MRQPIINISANGWLCQIVIKSKEFKVIERLFSVSGFAG
jgi:hypothetical protein